MVYFPPGFKDTVLDKVELVELIGQDVQLKQGGGNFLGLCPFHQEKTPSFNIWQDNQTFKCFGCGKFGDAITYMMEQFRLTFPEALGELAKRYGIPIPESSDTVKREKSYKEDIYKANAIALSLFKKCYEDKSGSIAKDYFEKRGFNLELVDLFQIGFSPIQKSKLKEVLKENNISDLVIEKSCLYLRGEHGEYPAFSNRLMFPIINERGAVQGFGGRSLDPEAKVRKYVNSSDTETFHKSKTLFGMNIALEAMKNKKKVIIAEGYTDVIMMHQFGIKNSVAVLGTALTADHLKYLKRFVKEAVLVLDGDDAGRRAMMRSMENFLAEDFQVSIAILPDKMDPCEMLSSRPTDEFKECLIKRITLVDFLVTEFNRIYSLQTATGKSDASKHIIKLLSSVKDNVLLSALVSEISQKLQIDEFAIRSNFKSLMERKKGLASKKFKKEKPKNYVALEEKQLIGSPPERYLLAVCLQKESVVGDLLALEINEYLFTPEIVLIFNSMIKLLEDDKDLAGFESDLDQNLRLLIDRLKYEIVPTDENIIMKEFENLKQIRLHTLEKDLKLKIEVAQRNNNTELLNELVLEFAQLRK